MNQIPSKRRHLPRAVGYVWNAIVFLVWAFLMAALISVVIDPVEENAMRSPITLVVVYPVLIGIMFTMVAYMLIYKRSMKGSILFFKRYDMRSQRWAVRGLCAAVAMASVVLAVIIYSVF